MIPVLAARLAASEGPERAEAFADALENGSIDRRTGATQLQDRLHVARLRLTRYLDFLAELDEQELEVPLAALRAAAAGVRETQGAAQRVEVAWTYPGDGPIGFRTTGGVAREIVAGVQNELLLVGYSVTVDPERRTIAARVVDAISDAGRRGISVTAILNSRVAANREALLSGWPANLRGPAIYTWPEQTDAMASLHAKLLIADRSDALVTSANLTYHGLEGNIEMGLRITGPPARQIRDRFHDLIRTGALIPWDAA